MTTRATNMTPRMGSAGRLTADAPAEPVALTAPEVVAHLLDGLERAEWDYDPEIDTMELFLPAWEGRPGEAVPVGDDLYLRIEIETRVPLSVIIHAWTWWLGKHGVLPRAALMALPDVGALPAPARQSAVEVLKRLVLNHPADLPLTPDG